MQLINRSSLLLLVVLIPIEQISSYLPCPNATTNMKLTTLLAIPIATTAAQQSPNLLKCSCVNRSNYTATCCEESQYHGGYVRDEGCVLRELRPFNITAFDACCGAAGGYPYCTCLTCLSGYPQAERRARGRARVHSATAKRKPLLIRLLPEGETRVFVFIVKFAPAVRRKV